MIGCVLEHWQPGIGDPTWLGWATVGVYLATAILALRASRARFPAATGERERAFWILTLLLLAGLAINKQLDLQSALTATGRCLARVQGWYGQRHLVQMGFLAGLALGALGFLAILIRLGGSWSRSALPVMGLALVCSFVLTRAAGFQHADRILGLSLPGWRTNAALEWFGPVLISLAALRVLRVSG